VERERKATTGIGALFILLALLTLLASVKQLISQSHPETTVPGLLVSSISLSFMFFLWRSKKAAGQALDSRAVLQDAACSRACIQLSVVLFLGSIIYWLNPKIWWADSAAAMLIALFIAHEGWEAIRVAQKEDFSGGCCGCD
jgi:divalent metal cation (Fe/Co/Zn/Cd) transporter